jgi:hypothetical protein
VKTLYLCELDDESCLSHDGHIQLGIFDHSLETHMKLNPTINWVVVYWYPDVFKIRYKRVSFQKTEKANEGSPKTDNAGQGIDLPSKGCNKLEDK